MPCCSITPIYECHISLCYWMLCFETVVVAGQQQSYPVKEQKQDFVIGCQKKKKPGGISGSLKASKQKNKKLHNKKMKHKQLQNKAHFFFFFCESSSMSSQILNDMNVNVAAFPTALTDVNILGYKCCLQNVIRILTLCLI